MTTATTTFPVRDELRWFASASRAPKLRTMREFAEQEIIIPEGKHQGFRYNTSRQPFAGLLLDALSDQRFNRFVAPGCVQSGKTLNMFVIPILYHLLEMKESVVAGVPTIDMANDKWEKEIWPVFRRTKYRDLMPESGSGSRGGRFEELTFKNGATLKFMSGHGGDEKRSGFTARVVVITEADKMDTAGAVSRETDPISQLEARTLSYEEDKRVYMECTVSYDTGRIWQEYTGGTRSRIVVPCPHCGAWIAPERDDLIGWDGADDPLEAGRRAAWSCRACGEAIDEAERRAANQQAKLLHGDQKISKRGRISGEIPATRTLGFRWTAFHNLFWRTAHIAEQEWTAARAEHADAAAKKLLQFYWVSPYKPPVWDDTPLDVHAVAERRGRLPQGLLPGDTEFFTIGIDMGKKKCWYFCLAATKTGLLHVPDYGMLPVPYREMALEQALKTVLADFREVMRKGWPVDGHSRRRLPERIFVDSGWQPDAVLEFCREQKEGTKNRWMATLGRGLSAKQPRRYDQPKKTSNVVIKIGEGWHISYVARQRTHQLTFDCDHYKESAQDALSIPQDQVGAISFYDAPGVAHAQVARHLASEKKIVEIDPEKGEVTRWKKSGENHLLDCAANARAALNEVGFRLTLAHQRNDAAAGSWFAAQKAKRGRR